MVRAHEDGDAAVSTGANACGGVIARDVYLVKARVSRNRMGACRRRRAGILVNGIRALVDDAEYRTRRGQIVWEESEKEAWTIQSVNSRDYEESLLRQTAEADRWKCFRHLSRTTRFVKLQARSNLYELLVCFPETKFSCD